MQRAGKVTHHSLGRSRVEYKISAVFVLTSALFIFLQENRFCVCVTLV